MTPYKGERSNRRSYFVGISQHNSNCFAQEARLVLSWKPCA